LSFIVFLYVIDKGQGIETEDMIKKLDLANIEKTIENMLKEGEIFENMPGRLKILE
jgi:hypothetical protein